MEIRSQSPGIIPPIKAIRPGHDRRVRKQGVVFGVVGRVYKSGRKGEHLVEELARSGRYNIVSWGKGWPCPELFEGSPWESLPEFYRSIDYLVVTSLNEGGPIPLIDAIAAGVPVIAPREVGWCSEFPVIEYAAGRLESLDAILFQLTHPPDWDEWRGDHVDLFRLAFAYGKVGLR